MKRTTIDSIKTYMIRYAAVLLTALIIIAATAAVKVSAAADETGQVIAFEVLSYEFEADVATDHSYNVTKKIAIDLSDESSTVTLPMPAGNLNISEVKTSTDNGQIVRKSSGSVIVLSDSKPFAKGKHTFTITYKVREFADRDENKDMFYLYALSPEWGQPIGDLSIRITFPSDFPWDDMQYYAGQFGAQDNSSKIAFDADKASRTVTITGSKIPDNYAITIKDQLPEGYWQNALDGIWAVYAGLGFVLMGVILMLVLWFIAGRDPKTEKMHLDHPIEGITPAEVGFLFDGEFRIRDVIAFILYMGTKGYLKISEYRPKKYRLYKVSEPKDEQKFIRNAFNLLFEDVYDDRPLDVADIGPRLLRIVNGMSLDVESGFNDPEMASVTSRSKTFRLASLLTTGIILGVFNAMIDAYQYIRIDYALSAGIAVLTMLVTARMCHNYSRSYSRNDSRFKVQFAADVILYVAIAAYLAVRTVMKTGLYSAASAIVALAVAAAVLTLIMVARGTLNAEMTAKYRSLRRFIQHAESIDVETINKEEPNYYYDMVPYAYLFSSLETWARLFEGLKVSRQDWYSDDIEGHAESNNRTSPNVVDLAKDVKIFARTIEDGYRALTRSRIRLKRKI